MLSMVSIRGTGATSCVCSFLERLWEDDESTSCGDYVRRASTAAAPDADPSLCVSCLSAKADSSAERHGSLCRLSIVRVPVRSPHLTPLALLRATLRVLKESQALRTVCVVLDGVRCVPALLLLWSGPVSRRSARRQVVMHVGPAKPLS